MCRAMVLLLVNLCEPHLRVLHGTQVTTQVDRAGSLLHVQALPLVDSTCQGLLPRPVELVSLLGPASSATMQPMAACM
jgi:hypothetical protein